MKKLLTFIALLLIASQLPAAQVAGVRLWTAPDHTRLVFDTTGPAEHKVFSLAGPDRLVIDISDATVASDFSAAEIEDIHLGGLRHAPRPDGGLRVVLDLKQPVRPKTFLLKPNASYGHRLVVDLYPVEAAASPRVAKSATDIERARDIVVAVDAGHGGDDPGASGSRFRTEEKDVTLQIARRLKRLIDAEPGMRAVLTRDGDYYIGLRKRMAIAREQRADLFVSIHADAFNDKRVRGSSVYVLSQRGASSEAARWLAEKENSSDLVGGVSLDDKDDVLASVLLDLSQSATQHASLSAASRVYGELGRVGRVHGRRVQQAGFMVLKSPDVPSMLVETGFISNPEEERNLRDPKHQERMAKAILSGVQKFFTEAPPPGTRLAERQRATLKHVISKGDTLSEIADRYQVSLGSLRRENDIRSENHIRIGQVLVIPDT
ncbi:MAG: N-acetylmuramoyl-L-alanine amidase [Sedimenticolaceae bacterium]|nr:N-acetylmuramoyl-L-alanine amidase [Chromatiaceae bacterium]MCP5439459.1 N-acetylmuramoyl-L-alanine amidase [Chromatiaceae bacterium]HPE78472.1 N-acetylmuramoyl-L-alanine amidase [Gammaproteobacteria bacterium]